MATRRDYTDEMIKAAHSVLVEVMHLLGEYRDHIVLIGGWVPEFLMPKHNRPYVGSMDVDLALDHRRLPEEGYQSIHELLLGREGISKESSPLSFTADSWLVVVK